MRRLGSLLVVLLAGCIEPVAYTPAREFPDSEREEIWKAARAWDAIVKPERRIRPGNNWIVVREEPPYGFNGYASRTQRKIWIRPVPGGGVSTYAIAIHEWGHALGLRHICTAPGAKGDADPRPCGSEAMGVMDPMHVGTTFSEDDKAECRRAGACE